MWNHYNATNITYELRHKIHKIESIVFYIFFPYHFKIFKYFLSEGITYNGATKQIYVTGDVRIPVLSEICNLKWVYYIFWKGGRTIWTQKLQRPHGFSVLRDLYHVPGVGHVCISLCVTYCLYGDIHKIDDR